MRQRLHDNYKPITVHSDCIISMFVVTGNTSCNNLINSVTPDYFTPHFPFHNTPPPPLLYPQYYPSSTFTLKVFLSKCYFI